MKIRKGDLVYTDGKQTIILKRRYAYHYSPGGFLVGQSEIEEAFFTRMKKAGFKKKDNPEDLLSVIRIK